MARLTRQQAVAALADGLAADLGAARAILALLERQFDAALRHRGAELAELAAELSPALDAMEARRQQRVTLVRGLAGLDATMAGLIAAQAEPLRAQMAEAWTELEGLVVRCKAATVRNTHLLAEQFSVMQRVLHGENDTYAPR